MRPRLQSPRAGAGMAPLCSRSAVRGLGGLSVFSNQLSPAPLGPSCGKGDGAYPPTGGSPPPAAGARCSLPGRQRPAPGPLLEALPCAAALTVAGTPPKPASAGAPDGPIPQLGRLFRKGRLLFFLFHRLFFPAAAHFTKREAGLAAGLPHALGVYSTMVPPRRA